MPAFLVTLPPNTGQAVADGVNAIVLFTSGDALDAKALAKSAMPGDGNLAWDEATVTEIVFPTYTYEGWVYKIIIYTSPVIEVTVVGGVLSDIDNMNFAMRDALNATPQIANSAYAPYTLTIAGIADGIGDKKVEATMTPPQGAMFRDPKPIPGFITSITDQGLAASALVLTTVTDAFNVPFIYGKLKQT